MRRRSRPSKTGLILGLGLLMAAVLAWSIFGPGPAAKVGPETTSQVQSGSSLLEIGAHLQDDGVISSQWLFALVAKASGASGHLKAGEYAFVSQDSLARVILKLREGRVVRHQFTAPEGLTSAMIVERLQTEPVLTGAADIPPEGTLLPETYQFSRGEPRADVLERMRTAQSDLLTRLWANRQSGLPFKSPIEAVILASIVEKETGKADERPKVAAVFINRLRQGMRLQSDPTIIYGISQGRPLGRGLTATELSRADPYNTYRIEGLPPTPIANPGRAALEAVLNPPVTQDLYFVADGTGGHAFAATLAAHNRNVAAWREIERRP